MEFVTLNDGIKIPAIDFGVLMIPTPTAWASIF